MCPNFLSPKLTDICSHSCSHPPLGFSHGRDFLYPIPGLPGLLSYSPLPQAPSPPSTPCFVLTLFIPMETHSSCSPTPPSTCSSRFPSAGPLLSLPAEPQASCVSRTPGLRQDSGDKATCFSSSFQCFCFLEERTLGREPKQWVVEKGALWGGLA